MQAKIYSPTKNTMQSGIASKGWVLEYVLDKNARSVDNIMGWSSNSDTKSQVLLHFSSQKQAEQYAKANNITYEIIPHTERKMKKKSYADNFK